MIRTQIQLTEAQSARVHEAARRMGVSSAEIIRQSIDSFLDRGAMAAGAPLGRLSALEVVGKWSCGLTDIADRHDDHLDEAYLPPTGS